MICPRCQGNKRSFCFVDYADGTGDQRWMDCHTCKGTGEVDDDYAKRYQQGWLLRAKRVHGRHYLTMKEMAEKCGVDVVTISKMEHGEASIPERIWLIYGLVQEATE